MILMGFAFLNLQNNTDSMETWIYGGECKNAVNDDENIVRFNAN